MFAHGIYRASWLPKSPDLELVIYVDGSSVPNPGPSGIGMLVVARTREGHSVHSSLRNIGFAGNNVTEFLGLFDAVSLARTSQARRAVLVSDSTVALRLMAGQLPAKPGEYTDMQRRATAWLAQNRHVAMCWVPRKRNLAHHLARQAATLPAGETQVSLLGQRPAQLLLLAS